MRPRRAAAGSVQGGREHGESDDFNSGRQGSSSSSSSAAASSQPVVTGTPASAVGRPGKAPPGPLPPAAAPSQQPAQSMQTPEMRAGKDMEDHLEAILKESMKSSTAHTRLQQVSVYRQCLGGTGPESRFACLRRVRRLAEDVGFAGWGAEEKASKQHLRWPRTRRHRSGARTGRGRHVRALSWRFVTKLSVGVLGGDLVFVGLLRLGGVLCDVTGCQKRALDRLYL